MKNRDIPLFLGTSTSVDKKNLEPFQAERELNARHEDGRLRARFGYKNLRTHQASFSAAYGLVYIQGINSSNAETEEYISFENLGAGVAAYTRNVTTMAPTAITGATSLHASDWTGFPWNDVSYFINPNHTTDLYRHVVGDATSWVAVAIPVDPTTALTATAVFNASGATAYDVLSWAGLDPTSAGELACTGLATNTGSALNSDSTFSVRHTAGSGGGNATWAVDLDDITAADQDWQYNDAFAFTLVEDSGLTIDPFSVKLILINEDGSPITFNLITHAVRDSANPKLIRVWAYATGKTRAEWDNIGQFKLDYNVVARSGTAANNDLTVGKPFIGCCFPFSVDPTSSVELVRWQTVRFGYSQYYSTPVLESGIAGAVTFVSETSVGYNPLGGGVPTQEKRLGSFIKFGLPGASADSNVDNYRLYWEDVPGPGGFGTPTSKPVWRRIVTQVDATTSYYLKASWPEMLAMEAASTTGLGGFLTSPLVNAFPFKEWVVWLYDIGEANVRHSRVREAEQQANVLDQEGDFNRGANFTLADNFADTPQGGCQVGNSAVIFGKNGVYEQVQEGDTDGPSAMSPCKKLPGSFGAANKFAFARWKDDQGNPGVAFVDRHGSGVYFAYPSGVGDRDAEGRVLEISTSIRGELRRFLLEEQGSLSLTDFSTCEVFVDDAQDALGVKMGRRIIWLRRPNTVTGQREWEFADYNCGGTTVYISRIAASPKRRVRMMRTDGKTDELEWNSADAVFVQGLNRDGGNKMPVGFWRSKAFSGQNRRVIRMFLQRDRDYEEARAKVISDRRQQWYKFLANKKFTSCAADQQGFDIQFEIEIPEMDGHYSKFSWDEQELGRRTNL